MLLSAEELEARRLTSRAIEKVDEGAPLTDTEKDLVIRYLLGGCVSYTEL